LVEGPHEILHEYVSSNWDHGALYTLLDFDILPKIPVDGSSHVSELAKDAGLPKDKLEVALRLAACDGIVREVSDSFFGHTAISEVLVKDKGVKNFLEFQ
jgi:hypothetical protein